MVISGEQYKNLSPKDRADVSLQELRQLYTSLMNRESRGVGSELRNAIERKLGIRPVCRCGCESFLEVCSRACDNNYYKLPNGREGEGYFPAFSGLGALGGDGPMFSICTECGRIYGFDKNEMTTNIAEAEDMM